MNTAPESGKVEPAAICDLAKAAPNDESMPMTSPVDFISGPSPTSTFGKRWNGNTASFTETCFGMICSVNPMSLSDLPIITWVAICARGFPIALLTNGTVLDARGFTSST